MIKAENIRNVVSVMHSDEPFINRRTAGVMLGQAMAGLHLERPLVLGIPRGGVIIALEIARMIRADMDILLAHKIGAPDQDELAVGAVNESGKVFLNNPLAMSVGAGKRYVQQEKDRQLITLVHRKERFRKIHGKIPIKDRTVIITDDGVATGATMQAAVWAVRQERPEKLIVALPIGPMDTLERIGQDADLVFCLNVPHFFNAVGEFYTDFDVVTDDEVEEVLKEAERGMVF